MGICSKLVTWHFHCSFILIKTSLYTKLLRVNGTNRQSPIRGKHMCILDFKKYNFPKIFDQTLLFLNIKANNIFLNKKLVDISMLCMPWV
jgi:hypothetical protein